MKRYYVAKTQNGKFIGRYSLEEIAANRRAGEFQDDYVVTESTGPSYVQLLKIGGIPWVTVSQLLADHSLLVGASVSSGEQASTETSAPNNTNDNSGGMDFKKLAGFISALGSIALLYGFIQFSINQPEQQVQAKATSGENTISGLAESLKSYTEAHDANFQISMRNTAHAQAQDTAKKFMLAGAVVLFLGFGISASVKK